MSGTPIMVQRSLAVAVTPEQVWRLLSSPHAWSLRPGLFAFDAEVPSAGRVRVVLGTAARRTVCGAYEVVEEVPGRVISLRSAGPVPSPGSHILTLSAGSDGAGTLAGIEVRYMVRPGSRVDAGRDYWRGCAEDWLGELRQAAEGRVPPPPIRMPEQVRMSCTPARPLWKPQSVSASAVIAAPPGRVWEVVRAPELMLRVSGGYRSVCAGVVPGTPVGQAGEMQYVIRRSDDGRLVAQIIVVTELVGGRSAATADIVEPHAEMLHAVTPEGGGTRLDLTYRWPAEPEGSSKKSYVRQVAGDAQAMANGVRDLIENPHGHRE